MHVDDDFAVSTNKEVGILMDSFSKIFEKVEKITAFVDNKEILTEVYKDVENQYKENSGIGINLQKDLDYSDEIFSKFEVVFENDSRLTWLHFGLAATLVFLTVLCTKIITLEKVKTIT